MAGLVFTRLYVQRGGRSVELNFAPISAAASVVAATDDVVVGAVAAVSLPIAVSAVTDDSVVGSIAIASVALSVAFTIDDVVASAAAVASLLSSISITTDDVVIDVLGDCTVADSIVVACALDDTAVDVVALYNSNVFRGVRNSVGIVHFNGHSVGVSKSFFWNLPTHLRPTINLSFEQAERLDLSGTFAWQSTKSLSRFLKAESKTPVGFDLVVDLKYLNPVFKRRTVIVDEQDAEGLLNFVEAGWLSPDAKFKSHFMAFRNSFELSLKAVVDASQASNKSKQARTIVWQDGNSHNWVITRPVIPPEPPQPRDWLSDLVFSCLKPSWVDGRRTTLVFVLQGCPWPQLPFIQKKRAYLVRNEVYVYKLPELIPLDALQINISGDVDSWSWSFTSSFKTLRQYDLLAPVDGNPVEVRVIVNGETWDFVVESRSKSREFGNNGFGIKGRSLSAYLADPYALVTADSNNSNVTANQLADLAVLDTGWSIDWEMLDWLVLAGGWNHRGTPISRLVQIAEAVGGVVLSAKQARVLTLAKRYPVLPWDWSSATPWAQVPIDVMVSMGGETDNKPYYNAVYVSGESVGVSARVMREGSAADKLAPSKVNALLTHVDACRMAGESILADTGLAELIPISMPVEQNLGVVPLNVLLEIDDAGYLWRCMTRSQSITAQWQQDGLVVRQIIEVERRG